MSSERARGGAPAAKNGPESIDATPVPAATTGNSPQPGFGCGRYHLRIDA
jgi:hypothetical protein